MKFLSDPRLFNFVLLALYILNMCRWALAKNGPQSVYWLGAALLNGAITWQVSK